MNHSDVIILGAGAAGLMAAIEAAKRGRSVIVLEHNRAVGEKIRISGGGRCNFTNIHAESGNFLSANPDFCRSALTRYTPEDFIRLVERHRIRYHEKKLGQLFCDASAQQIIDMLLEECRIAGVTIRTGAEVADVRKSDRFRIALKGAEWSAAALVIASGGLSVPKLGATDLGYRVARQFGLPVVEPRPGLVPFVFRGADWKRLHELSGVSLEAGVTCGGEHFREHVLFTHRGLSGPAVLQASSYWRPGEAITIDLLPGTNAEELLSTHRSSRKELATVLESHLPARFVRVWLDQRDGSRPMNALSTPEIRELAEQLKRWRVVPSGTEGLGKAEVTVGGVDTRALSSKTMEARSVPGLYFVGEVMDVAGWLGGYNFQWAWSSGWVAGQSV